MIPTTTEPSKRTAIVTGASRGIGAETALRFAQSGYDVVITYRNKAARASEVADEIRALGRACLAVQLDLTNSDDLRSFMSMVSESIGSVDALVLNAAGGLEKDKESSYAYALNVEANLALVDQCAPLMPQGSSILYITSHMAHFYGQRKVLQGYQVVASTKRAAEDSLRAEIPKLTAKGIKLLVVSGDLIQGTVNSKLLDRKYSDLLSQRINDVGALATIADFADVVVDAAHDGNLTSGDTVFIGSTDWGTYEQLFHDEVASQTPAAASSR